MLGLTQSDWRPRSLSDLPSDLGRVIAIDCETRDPTLRERGPGVRTGAYVVGVSVGWFGPSGDPVGVYLPIDHGDPRGSDPLNLPREQVLAWLAERLAAATTIVGANLSYDLDFLQEAGVKFPSQARYWDVLLCEGFLQPLEAGLSLQAVSERRGLAGKREGLISLAAAERGWDPKGDLWRLPVEFVGAYGEEDAALPLTLYMLQRRDVSDMDVGAAWDVECRLLPVLVAATRRGVRIDPSAIDRIAQAARRERKDAVAEFNCHLPADAAKLSESDLMRNAAIAPLLQALGEPVGTSPDGHPIIRRDTLERMAHPAATALVRARRANKLLTTFVASIERCASSARLHPGWIQLAAQEEMGTVRGARFGRMSSVRPNLQQQPARGSELAKAWRSLFLPEHGEQFISCDYSAQEPRWLLHWAAQEDWASHALRNTADVTQSIARMLAAWRADPAMDAYAPIQAAAGLPGTEGRETAKVVVLARAYGAGGGKIAQQLRLPWSWAVYRRWPTWTTAEYASREEADTACAALPASAGAFVAAVAGPQASAIIARIDSAAPYVKALGAVLQRRAEQDGFVRAADGRRLPFAIHRGRVDGAYRALNRVIQGSAAAQTKAAIVACHDAGILPTLMVHDELCASGGKSTLGRMVDVMRQAMPCQVPAHVAAGIGSNWSEAK